jgi:hypothetical protein
MWTVAGSWRFEIKKWVSHDSFCEAKGTQKFYRPDCRTQKVVTILARERSFIREGEQSFTEGNVDMYEGVFCSRRRDDSELVATEFSVGDRQHGRRSGRFRERKLALLLLGGALCACADDSTADNSNHHKHRHGNGHGREQVETVDRSGDSNNSSPAPASTPGW